MVMFFFLRRNQGQYQQRKKRPIFSHLDHEKQAWSIKDLLYGQKGKFFLAGPTLGILSRQDVLW